VDGVHDGHGGVWLQQIHEAALVTRVAVLHDHEREIRPRSATSGMALTADFCEDVRDVSDS
jgi:hypothetical protein